jgi:hypothetical protein
MYRCRYGSGKAISLHQILKKRSANELWFCRRICGYLQAVPEADYKLKQSAELICRTSTTI